MEERLSALGLQRYLPAHLTGDPAAAAGHLKAVLDAVLTYLPRHIARTRLARSPSRAPTRRHPARRAA